MQLAQVVIGDGGAVVGNAVAVGAEAFANQRQQCLGADFSLDLKCAGRVRHKASYYLTLILKIRAVVSISLELVARLRLLRANLGSLESGLDPLDREYCCDNATEFDWLD